MPRTILNRPIEADEIAGLGDLATMDEADLSDSIELRFDANGTVAAGGFLSAGGEAAGSNAIGPKLPWGAQLVSAMAWKDDVTTECRLGINASGSLVDTLTIDAADNAAYRNAIAQPFSADDVINIEVLADLTGGGGIVLQFRRRTGL